MNKGIQKIFSEVPKRYELLNHLLTFGLDIICRRRAARLAAEDGGQVWLDICSGTGEMASYLRNISNGTTTIIAGDFCLPMLHEATRKSNAGQIRFLLTDAAHLPFPDNSLDLITISFATRNINTSRENLIATLSEFHRVLKPGGRFINLETSQPPVKLMRSLMHLYVRLTVRRVGTLISGSRSGYAYLSSTVPRFYEAEELVDIMHQAGFREVSFRRMFFGITAIHKAVK